MLKVKCETEAGSKHIEHLTFWHPTFHRIPGEKPSMHVRQICRYVGYGRVEMTPSSGLLAVA